MTLLKQRLVLCSHNICGHKIRKANVADSYLNGKYMYFIVVLLQEHRFAPNLILFKIGNLYNYVGISI